ncbi:MAG TPA: hypothetical protein VKZ68_07200 [Ohtaekwangia sp.]|nr:hypothetical protein [Ohtaekwangia sp.]
MRCPSVIIALLFAAACASTKSNSSIGHTRTRPVTMLNDNTYLLTEPARDATYGYDKKNPVKVGSEGGSGPVNERRFLNALLGPNGESIWYARAGSCCQFKTPNGLFGDAGLLDIYRVTWQGSKDTVSIYINMYDKGDLYIPAGFTARR